MSPEEEPPINHNPALQRYYGSLETRIGYRLFLGGRRHFGYYQTDTYWPFPINGALEAMEDHVFSTLKLPSGAEVLDAGCGDGYVAMHLARKGLHVEAIDVVDRHVQKAQCHVKAESLEEFVKVRKADYHHLDRYGDESFDGVYCVESFVHATNPETVLSGFFRVLKPGAKFVSYQYFEVNTHSAPEDLQESAVQVHFHTAVPAFEIFDERSLRRMLEDTGFEDIVVKDLSVNVWPMVRLFFIIGFLPYLLTKFLGLQDYFLNTMIGVQTWRGRNYWRYVAVSAKKPSDAEQNTDGVRDGKKIK